MKRITFLLLLISHVAFGQMRNYNTVIGGFKSGVFTPQSYDSTKSVNVVIVMGGNGQTGGANKDITKLYSDGLFKVLKDGVMPPGNNANSVYISLQNDWGGYDGKFPAALAEIETRWKINKLSLTGLSSGGGNVWEQITMVSQSFSGKFFAVEALSPASFQPANAAWVKNTTTKFLSRAGLVGTDGNYNGVAQNAANVINTQAVGRCRLIINAAFGHGVNLGFITPYKDTVFWNFIDPGTIPTTPPIVTPPTLPPTGYVTYAQLDSAIRVNVMVLLKSNITTDGYMPKEAWKTIDSLGKVVSGNFSYFDNLTKAQAASITALQTKVTSLETRMAAAETKLTSYGTRITQNEINIQQLGTQVDINKLKIQGIIIEIDKFLVALRSIL